MPPTEIMLGEVTVPVTPQRWAYLANRCGKTLADIFASGEGIGDVDEFLAFVGEGAYDLLAAVCPALGKRMPRYTFMGYGSQAAMDAGEYDDEQDTGPTFPQIRDAFSAVVEVNGLHDIPGLLGKAIGPSGMELARAQMLLKVSESTVSPNSPSQSGESDSTSSTTTDPTADGASEDSPSPASAA